MVGLRSHAYNSSTAFQPQSTTVEIGILGTIKFKKREITAQSSQDPLVVTIPTNPKRSQDLRPRLSAIASLQETHHQTSKIFLVPPLQLSYSPPRFLLTIQAAYTVSDLGRHVFMETSAPLPPPPQGRHVLHTSNYQVHSRRGLRVRQLRDDLSILKIVIAWLLEWGFLV